MILRLRAGETAVRRDDRHLQIGIDPPHRVIVPDTVAARRAAYELEHGRGLNESDLADPAVASLVRTLEAADLLATEPVPLSVRLVGPDDLISDFRALAPIADTAPLATVLLSTGPLSRQTIDPLVRAGTPHLVVAGDSEGWTIGPYVIPGVTACLRCADAERSRRDPRRGLIIEQYAARTGGNGDPVGKALALAYAVREVRILARGARPTTWNALVRVADHGSLEPVPIRRHPDCGCSWGIAVAN